MAGGPQAGGQTQAPFNVNQAAAQGIQGAGLGTAAGMGYQPGQIATTDMSQYMNPYTQQVVDTTQADILRGAQQGMNQLDAQASAAKSFGGSRHGIAMGEVGRGVADQLAKTSAGLRQQGYSQALQSAGQDIQSGLQGAQHRLGAAGQLANISNLGFGMGQTVTQNLAQQGQTQQVLQQALIDAAKNQYQQRISHPATGLGLTTAALGASPVPQTTTNTRDPGLFDYLTMAATII